MLMKISEYRATKFTPSSRPSINTIKKWVDNGAICGQNIGGMYFIETNKIAPVNDLVNKVLQQ